MAYRRRALYVFNNKSDIGLNELPLTSVIHLTETRELYVLVDLVGVDENTTFQEAIENNNVLLIVTDGEQWLEASGDTNILNPIAEIDYNNTESTFQYRIFTTQQDDDQGTKYKLDTMQRMVKDFNLDGVILHSDRSCKPYSIGQIDQRNRLIQEFGIPALLLEADHDDPRAYAEEQVASRLASFVEMLVS